MQRLYSQFIGFVLVVLITCSCVSFNIPSQSQTKQRIEGRILVWYSLEGKTAELAQQSLDDYTRIYPNVKIVSEYVPEAQLSDLFIKQVKNGLGPDILFSNYGIIPQLVQEGVIEDLTDANIDVSSYFPSSLNQVRYQGRLYGLPTSLLTQVLCYNKDKVKSPATTLDGLLQQAKTGYSVGIFSNFAATFWGAKIFGGKLFDEQNRVILDGGGWAKWMEWLKQAQNEPNMIFSDNVIALREAFSQGNLAYVVCDSQTITQYFDIFGREGLGVAVLPGDGEQSAGPLIYARVMVFNAVSSASQKELALQVAQFINNTDQMKKRLIALEASFIPVNKNVNINNRLFPIQAVLNKQAKTAVFISLDNIELTEKLFVQGERLYQKVMVGDLSSTEAASQLSTEMKMRQEKL
ncbi:ABC transporter substrate-binding protein [Gloeothece verrucosa]|uniref:ABC transporter substrate-binding protein n=1 Tax=Gloeothece verrucosa TaxID=2546359 RepID=UPI0003164564|nr:extracellular solute-binding protein [Gloeothece verrucosa]